MKTLLITLLLITSLTGCVATITDHQRATLDPSKVVTILDDTRTRDGIRTAMTDWLTANGYTYEVVEERNYVLIYDQAITYEANWYWDVAMYMRFLKIHTFNQTIRTGSVMLDSVGCGAFGKFGSAADRTSIAMNMLVGTTDMVVLEKEYCKA